MSITLQELLVKVSADISSYASGMQGIESATSGVEASVSKLGGSLDTLTSGLDKMGGSLTRVGGMLTAAITLPLAGVSLAALKVAGDLEQAKVAFTTMLGSAEAAQKHLEALRSFAMTTPFEFGDLVTASKRLQALGFSAQQVIPTLTAIGDAAAGLGLGAQGIERISLALGQMQSKGKVSAQEMNQLAEAGINGWEMLAAAISKVQGKTVTVAETMKMAEKGMIDGTAAVQELLAGMESKFGGLMEAQSKTLLGMWSNLKDQLALTLSKIGDSLAPVAKSLIQDFTSLLPVVTSLVDSFTSLPEGVQKAALAFAAIGAAAGPALLVLGQFATSIAAVLKAFEAFSAFSGAAGIFSGLTAEAGVATTAVGGLSGALTALAGLAAPITSMVAGAFIGLSQLHNDTANLRSLNDEFDKFLLSKTQAFTGPLAPGVGMFDAGLKAINEALEKGLIDLDKYNKLMAMLKTNMDAVMTTSPEDLKEFGQGLSGSLGLKFPKGTIGGGAETGAGNPNLIHSKTPEELKKEADKAVAEIQQAFSALGVRDLQKQIDTAVAAFNRLSAAGKLTGEQMQQAALHIGKLRSELDQLGKRHVDQITVPTGLMSATGDFVTFVKMVGDLPITVNATVRSVIETFGGLREVIHNIADEQANMLRSLPNTVSKGFSFDSLTNGASNLENFNTLLLNTAAGFTTSESKAQQFFDTLNDKLGLSREQLQAMEDQVNKAGAEKFFGLQSAQELRLNAEEAQKYFDILVGTGEPAQRLLEIMNKTRDAQTALGMAQSAYNAGLINSFELQAKQLAAMEDAVRKQQEMGINISPEQSKAIFEIQQQQAKAMVDVWKSVHDEVSHVMDGLDAGLARAILNFKNFGSEMKKTLTGLFEDVFTDVFKTITKPLTDFLKKSLTDAIQPLASSLAKSLGLTAAGAGSKAFQGTAAQGVANLPITNPNIPGVTVPGLPSAPSGGVPSAGAGAAPASSSMSSLAGIANMANIASAIANIGAGITAGIQAAHLNNLMDNVEKNTRAAASQLVSLQQSANTYWPAIKGINDYLVNQQFEILKEIRDAIKSSVAVNLSVRSGTTSGDTLLDSIIKKIGTPDTLGTDRLLEIKVATLGVSSTLVTMQGVLVTAMKSNTDLLAGQLVSIAQRLPSQGEKILGAVSGVLGGIGGGLSGALSSVASGALGGLISGIGSLFKSDGADLGRIELNTRATLNQLVALQESANTYWPVLKGIVDLLGNQIFDAIGEVRDAVKAVASDIVQSLSDINQPIAAALDGVMSVLKEINIAAGGNDQLALARAVDTGFQNLLDGVDSVTSSLDNVANILSDGFSAAQTTLGDMLTALGGIATSVAPKETSGTGTGGGSGSGSSGGDTGSGSTSTPQPAPSPLDAAKQAAGSAVKSAIDAFMNASSWGAAESAFAQMPQKVQAAYESIYQEAKKGFQSVGVGTFLGGLFSFGAYKGNSAEVEAANLEKIKTAVMANSASLISAAEDAATNSYAFGGGTGSGQSGVPQGISGSQLPSDIGTQTAIMLVNNTCAMGFAAVLEQLKSMTSLSGGGGSTGAAGASAGDLTSILKTALGFTAGPEEQKNNAIAAAYQTPNTGTYLARALNGLQDAFAATDFTALQKAVDRLPPGAKDIAKSAISSIDAGASDALKQAQDQLSIVSQSIVDSVANAGSSLSGSGSSLAEVAKSAAQTIAELPPVVEELNQQFAGLATMVRGAQSAMQGVSSSDPDLGTFKQATMPMGALPAASGIGLIDQPTQAEIAARYFSLFPEAGYHPFSPVYDTPPTNPLTQVVPGSADKTVTVNINDPVFNDRNDMDYMADLIRNVV